MSLEQHPDEDVLERYAMNRLSEAEADAVEDHTSLCTNCMDRLDEAVAFVAVMKTELKKHEVAEPWTSRVLGWLRPAPPIWAAGAVAATVFLFVSAQPPPLTAISTVVLSGTRGTATVVHGTGPFNFQLFMPETAPRYHVEVLDQAGNKSWEGDATGENGNLHVLVGQRFAAGQYFLRVTEPVSKAVHDFGVKIER